MSACKKALNVLLACEYAGSDDKRVVSRIRSYRPSGISVSELPVLDHFLRCLTPLASVCSTKDVPHFRAMTTIDDEAEPFGQHWFSGLSSSGIS